MGNYILVIDCSGSMRNALPEIKNDAANEWLPWRLTQDGPNKVGLVAFGTDVCIKSYYSDDLQSLQNMVNSLTSSCCGGGMTSLWDAMIVALLYEDPKPDEITLWTDMGDNKSSATQSEHTSLANRLNIPMDFHEIPEHWWDDDMNTWSNAYILLGSEMIMKRAEYVKSLASIEEAVKSARVIRNPSLLMRARKKK